MARSVTSETIQPRKILLVDDDPLVTMTLELLLQADGHRTEAVSEPMAALAKLSEGNYDLVITDLSLPQMDGLKLAREIKRRVPGQPVILSSGSPEVITKDATHSADIDFMLGKPFVVEQLREAMATCLSRVSGKIAAT